MCAKPFWTVLLHTDSVGEQPDVLAEYGRAHWSTDSLQFYMLSFYAFFYGQVRENYPWQRDHGITMRNLCLQKNVITYKVNK